jgi:hypothetical protein
LPLSKPLFDGSDPLIENIKIIFLFMKNAPIQKEVDPPAYSYPPAVAIAKAPVVYLEVES